MRPRGNLPFTHVHVCLLAYKVCESPAHSLDRGQGKHDLLSSIDVRIEHTQNMLEVLVCNERLQSSPEQERKNHQYSSFPSEPLVHVDDIGNQNPRERGERERERERERETSGTNSYDTIDYLYTALQPPQISNIVEDEADSIHSKKPKS
jgi:negative regulator of genetic competence, sporulation and motility